MLLWVVVLVGVLLLLYISLWLRNRFTEPPNAPPLVRINGNRFAAAQMLRTEPDHFLEMARKEYGPVFTIDLLFFKQILITDFEGLDFIYGSKDDTLSFYESIKIFLNAMLGEESIRERPEYEHIERANKVASTLLKNKKVFFSYIMDEVNEWLSTIAAQGKPVDFYEEADKLITNINIHCFIGKEMRDKYAVPFKELYDELERKGITMSALLAPWFPFVGDGWKCKQIRKEIASLLEPIIIERQKLYKETGHQQVDYLNEYIVSTHKHNNQPWTMTEMIERTLAIFFAARVNTLRTFFWSGIHIAARKNIVERLRQDLDEMKEFDFESVKGLKYIDNCIKESVRPVHSIIPGARIAMKDVKYKDYVIPKGYAVGVSGYFISRDPTIFPQPEEFLPERWDKENLSPKMKSAWIFFGNGQHRCKGEDFANLTLRTGIATIFKNYDMKWIDQKEDGQAPSFTFRPGLPYPDKPVMVTITPRSKEQH